MWIKGIKGNIGGYSWMVGIKDFEMPSCCNSCGHWSFNSDDEPLCDLTYERISQFNKRQDDCPLVEAIPKDLYEARLKDDMVAMLENLKSEIDHMPKYYPYIDHRRWYIDGDVFGLIQEKINALRGTNEYKSILLSTMRKSEI